MPVKEPRPGVVELFAGVGGFRLGLERSGWRVAWANQWEPSTNAQHAFDCYVGHFREGEHVCADIHAVLDEVEAGQRTIPGHELLVGGFPCFAAGTMVLTADGHKPIEDVRVGELVLTHRGRWRPVTSVMSRAAPRTTVIRGHGIPDVRTTPEHPFWARQRTRTWDPILGRMVRELGRPGWLEAARVTSSTFLGQAVPVEHVPAPVDLDQSDDFYWLVGRYLADGWRTAGRSRRGVVIWASPNEADVLEERIRRVFPCTRVRQRTVVKFRISRSSFHDWLEGFGAGAAGKRIPGWLLGCSEDQARALLEGYATGDGSPWQGGWRATTVSRALALGVALLMQHAYGVMGSLHPVAVPPETTIEGRTVAQQAQYQVVRPPRRRSPFIEDGVGWKLARSVRQDGPATVFNLSVEQDESYTADNCTVHNCQDYSVARTLNQATGIEGRKGVLWWDIHRLLAHERPRYLFLENVDRLLRSPAGQRGRDFAIMLAALSDLGYEVEWRVANAAEYGFPQKRRRTYIVGRLAGREARDPAEVIAHGTLGRALPIRLGAGVGPWVGLGLPAEEGHLGGAEAREPGAPQRSAGPGPLMGHQPSAGQRVPIGPEPTFTIDGHPADVSERFGVARGRSPFRNAGYMHEHRVWTLDVEPYWEGPREVLGDVLEPPERVRAEYVIPQAQLDTWRYLKGGKRERRTHRATGTPYVYAEGPIPFPDPTDRPARTILTGEGGATPSRFKHIVAMGDGRFRRLTPRELERLNGFPDDWTASARSDGRRAFLMGNAVIVGIIERIGRELMADLEREQDRGDERDGRAGGADGPPLGADTPQEPEAT